MAQTKVKTLLNAGVHFGHLTRKWDPNMAPYIYMERNGIHIIGTWAYFGINEKLNQHSKKLLYQGEKSFL